MKMDFKTIKQIMSEKYTQTEMELASLGGNAEKVADLLEAMGKSRDAAATIVQLIRSGMSEAEAVATLA